MANLQCQRIGCDARFSEDNNPEDSCTYHDSGPIFHDGMKEWSCCKKKSHDFSLFLEIPGCKIGKHTTEKPVMAKPAINPRKAVPVPALVSVPTADASSKEVCSRCRQGFFCSGHSSQPRESKPVDAVPSVLIENSNEVQESTFVPAKKIIDINEPQLCKNKGCGQKFKEKDNHDTACNYHPGPAIFHDRVRGWKCCNINVSEFEEFMSIPPCAKGWHNADV